MIPEQIEKIKSEYTDQYVAVISDHPELARFQNFVGQVKTVNMNGRALVEFKEYNLNSGRFDIDLDYLKVVDQPKPQLPKSKAKLTTAAPSKQRASQQQARRQPATAEGAAEETKLSPLELARMQGATQLGQPDQSGMSSSDGKASDSATEERPKEKDTGVTNPSSSTDTRAAARKESTTAAASSDDSNTEEAHEEADSDKGKTADHESTR
jgi:hypothetical protein